MGHTMAWLPAVSFYSPPSSRGAAAAASISTAPWTAHLPRERGRHRKVGRCPLSTSESHQLPHLQLSTWEAGNQNPQAEGICTEKLYLLVRYCQEVASLGATPAPPAFPRSHRFSFSSQLWVSRTSLLPMPAEHGSFESPLVRHPEKPQHW